LFSSPFFRRLFLPYLALVCLASGAVGLVGAARLRASYRESTRDALHSESVLLADLLGPELLAPDPAKLANQVRQLGNKLACRITIIRDDGKVMADNEADPDHMENHRTRPEVLEAAADGEGSSIRSSATLHQGLFYLARRMDVGGQIYFLRLAVHQTDLNHHLDLLYASLAAAVLLAALAAGIVCYYFARRHATPVVELTEFAEALSQGELDRRINRPLPDEFGQLADTLNTTADSLGRLLSQTAQDSAELLAILSSMSEGVIATDIRQRILLVNAGAGQLLGFDFQDARGKLLYEAMRNEQILRAASDVLAGTTRTPFQVGPLGGRHLEVTVCTFAPEGAAKPSGLVIVTHDTTQSVRYQELRKEFVANVSHELRTPLTVIKGFIETLSDGALHDPEKGPQYLATIQKHADQLSNVVNDLLELSRLESQSDLPRRSIELPTIVQRAVDLLVPAAQKKRQNLSVEVDAYLPRVSGNADYLERAVANLVDNAIKYTPDSGAIQVSVHSDNGHVVVEVTDTGIGIPEDDLPRIFERFYRVDRSRSREMGGTGLGLSIVKHVAQTHGGAIDVASTPGKGTVFKLRLPVAGAALPE